MAEIIFGIDHGNGNMKGENVCFPCGLVRYVSEPGRFMNEDILEYQGTYYTLSDTKMPFKADKTVDDDYFILTLYALAMEARNKGITLTGKDVVLGVGLPPADYGQQATSFKKYFLDHAKHGISFKMNGKSVNFYLKDVSEMENRIYQFVSVIVPVWLFYGLKYPMRFNRTMAFIWIRQM